MVKLKWKYAQYQLNFHLKCFLPYFSRCVFFFLMITFQVDVKTKGKIAMKLAMRDII